MAKFTKINFLLNFRAVAWAFGTAIASILVKMLHPKKDVGNFWEICSEGYSDTHAAVNRGRRRVFISERTAACCE